MSEVQNLYRVTPRRIIPMIEDCLYAGLVPMVTSSPGCGKSSIMRKLARRLKLYMIDHRLSTSEPTDMSGLPNFNSEGFAYFAPFTELFPIESTPIPEDHDGWMIFLDELNSASKQVMAASYKLILDKMIGQHRLHNNAVITAAGNLDTDRAITNSIGTAMESRLIHLELEIITKEWLEDVAGPENYDSRIVAYLNHMPSKLLDFRPDHSGKTFCCPRTWEYMNRLISGKPIIKDEMTPLYAGTITAEVAAEFVQFTKIFRSLTTIKQIVDDPHGCHVPRESDVQWALIVHVLDHVEASILTELITYAGRFPMQFKVFFFRALLRKYPQFRRHSAMMKVMSELSRYLFNSEEEKELQSA